MLGKYEVFGLLLLICGHHTTTATDTVLQRVRRLINGNSVPEGKPWMAVLAYKNTQGLDQRPYLIVCGGVLIDTQHLLLTAHCLDDNRFQDREDPLHIVLGLTENTWGETNDVQEFNLDDEEAAIRLHPEFRSDGDVFENDIALVTLASPCSVNSYTSPISLAPRDADDNNVEKCTIFGWGITGEPASEAVFTRYLRSAPLTITSANICAFSFLDKINDDHICAEGTAFPCFGDSGSPLMCEFNNEIFLFGLNSFRQRGACDLGKPQVYTRISTFKDWIASVIGNSNDSDDDDDSNDDD